MSLDLKNPDKLADADLGKVLCDLQVAVDGKDAGTMTLEFWPDAAPGTVRNFLRYAADGFYDGQGFHRVIDGFMIQGGCPQGTGTGSGPRGQIKGEFSKNKAHGHKRGVISMARSQDPNSASCQFFICHGDAAFLDGQYAAFGKLTAGDAALDAIAKVPCAAGGGEKSKPTKKCTITSMRLRAKE
jgi:peptidyl-prolyl cis-trans isomerase B (cyclophilin B)